MKKKLVSYTSALLLQDRIKLLLTLCWPLFLLMLISHMTTKFLAQWSIKDTVAVATHFLP